jgi:hypothetical protein
MPQSPQPTVSFYQAPTDFEQQLKDILKGQTWSDEMEVFRQGIGKPTSYQIQKRNSMRGLNIKNFEKMAREFDAMKGIGTIFASGLKLKKADKRFRSGQSSLFIQ